MNDEDFCSNTAATSLSSYKYEIYLEDKRRENAMIALSPA